MYIVFNPTTEHVHGLFPDEADALLAASRLTEGYVVKPVLNIGCSFGRSGSFHTVHIASRYAEPLYIPQYQEPSPYDNPQFARGQA